VKTGPLKRFWEFLLRAGEYDGERRDQRARRRIVIAIVWVSVPGLALAAANAPGPWASALDGLKAAAHLSALLAVWARPRRLVAIFLAMSVIDLSADAAISVLTGGFYESGLQMMWSLAPAIGLLVVATVRIAGFFLVAALATTAFVVVASSRIEATYVLESPEVDGFLTTILALSFVFLGLFYFVRQRDRFQRESDDLLDNILPEEIAERLKLDDSMIADSIESASVLFADVVDFTPLSATMTPDELVGLLNDVFAKFDGLVDELGMEKIKTIGDEYMAAAGVPRPRADHAHAAAELALRIRDHVAGHDFGGNRIRLRIGINSGAVVAGIIGVRKFAYDLWGDVVNTASRMESAGIAGEIQITEATYNLIKDDFVCEPRGRIDVKGKGQMATYLVTGRAQPHTGTE
jgi:guanylate cyclase